MDNISPSQPQDPYLPMYCSPRKSTRGLTDEEKETRYTMAYEHLALVLKGETNLVARMATISCILNGLMECFYWTGFYLVDGDSLVVGPYQGTMGCLRIAKGRGVCGQAWLRKETVLVPDVHEFPEHIACDPSSLSEIVIPVFNEDKEVIAVFDVDSNIRNAFDDIDAEQLAKILSLVVQDI